MSNIFALRADPTGPVMSEQDFSQAATSQPFSMARQFGESAIHGALGSFGLGTVIRESQIPQRAPRLADDAYIAVMGLPEDQAAALRAGRDRAQAGIDKAYNVMDDEAQKASVHFRPEIGVQAGMTPERQAALADWHDAKVYRELALARGNRAVAFAGEVLGGALDPINYIPVLGPEVRAAALARWGWGGAAAVGAADAALNTAIAGTVTAPARKAMGDDASWQDILSQSAMAAAFGSVFGAAAHGIGTWRTSRKLNALENVAKARAVLNEGIDGTLTGGGVQLSPAAIAEAARFRDEAARLEGSPEGTGLGAISASAPGNAAKSGDAPPVPALPGQMAGLGGDIEPAGGRSWGADPAPSRPQTAADIAGDAGPPPSPASGKEAIERPREAPRLQGTSLEAESGLNRPSGADRAQAPVSPLESPASIRDAEPGRVTAKDRPGNGGATEPATRDKADASLHPGHAPEPLAGAIFDAALQHPGRAAPSPRAFDPSPPRPVLPNPTIAEAAARIGKPEDLKALAADHGIDIATGTHGEERALQQLGVDGRWTPQDRAVLDEMERTIGAATAWSEALRIQTQTISNTNPNSPTIHKNPSTTLPTKENNHLQNISLSPTKNSHEFDTIPHGNRIILKPVEIEFKFSNLTANQQDFIKFHLSEQESTLNRLSLLFPEDLKLNLENYKNVKSLIANPGKCIGKPHRLKIKNLTQHMH